MIAISAIATTRRRAGTAAHLACNLAPDPDALAAADASVDLDTDRDALAGGRLACDAGARSGLELSLKGALSGCEESLLNDPNADPGSRGNTHT